MDKRAATRNFNTLNGLVKGLEGEKTVIDLRNENSVCGKIVHVDAVMNVDMEDAILYDNRGASWSFEKFFVNSRNIRYVHIPDHLSPIEVMKKVIEGMRKPRNKKKPHTYKKVRAERYQKEILRSAYKEGTT